MLHRLGLIAGLIIFLLVLLLPLPDLSSPAQIVLATAALMAVWWICESIPLAATALLPLVVFPLGRVASVSDISGSYMDPNIVLFMGGFFLAMAIRKWGLHRRVALWIVYWLGGNPRRMVLGFMVATAVLSMWVSNTATAIMMLPIGTAVILRMQEGKEETGTGFASTLMLAIAYAASIGGVATLIGTPPNIVFSAQFSALFPQEPEITFLKWMLLGLPFVLLFIPIAWLYLTRIHSRVSGREGKASGSEVIREEIAQLGHMSKEEKWTAAVFGIAAFGWIFRKDLVIGWLTLPGWASLLGVSQYVHDATVAIFCSLLLFSIPVNWKKKEFLLDWDWARKIPWGILLLFGGGIALAEGFQSSGLAAWVAGGLDWFQAFPLIVLIPLTCLMITFLTEMTSNTATATIFMPILAAAAVNWQVAPEMLMIPATISASCAFMLPVATPPNAIVFGSDFLTIPQMARAGLWLNFIGAMITTLVVAGIGPFLFNVPFLRLFF